MKKVLSTLSAVLITVNAFAIDPSGSRMDYGVNAIRHYYYSDYLLQLSVAFGWAISKIRMAKEMRPE